MSNSIFELKHQEINLIVGGISPETTTSGPAKNQTMPVVKEGWVTTLKHCTETTWEYYKTFSAFAFSGIALFIVTKGIKITKAPWTHKKQP